MSRVRSTLLVIVAVVVAALVSLILTDRSDSGLQQAPPPVAAVQAEPSSSAPSWQTTLSPLATAQAEPSPSAASCADFEQQLRNSRTLGQRLDALVALNANCPSEKFDRVAQSTIDTALAQVASDQLDAQAKVSLLTQVAQLDALNWRALQQLAALEYDDEHWPEAAGYAISALLAMPASKDDPELARIAEDLADIRDFARDNSERYVEPPPATRGDGFRGKHRGELVLRVMQEPVEFEDNSVVPTAKGRRALQQLVENLRTELRISAPRDVSILGHTDERGSAEYNCDLSRRRAKAVRDELARAGLLDEVTVHVVAQGKQNPRRSERADRLSIEQRQQFDRRVQWAPRKPSPRERKLCGSPSEPTSR